MMGRGGIRNRHGHVTPHAIIVTSLEMLFFFICNVRQVVFYIYNFYCKPTITYTRTLLKMLSLLLCTLCTLIFVASLAELYVNVMAFHCNNSLHFQYWYQNPHGQCHRHDHPGIPATTGLISFSILGNLSSPAFYFIIN